MWLLFKMVFREMLPRVRDKIEQQNGSKGTHFFFSD